MKSPLASYREDGYAVVKGFIPAGVVTAYAEFLQCAVAEQVEPVFARIGLSAYAKDAGTRAAQLIKEKDKELSAAEKHILLGHFPLEVRLCEAIYPLAEALGKSQVLHTLLSSDALRLHMPPMMRFVPPGYMPAAVPPHQDISYNRHMSSFLTVWTPLVPITEECGGLFVYEGSQTTPEQVHDAQGSDWLPPVDTGKWNKRKLIGLVPGDVVVLSPLLVHESAPNTSDRIRLSMDLRLFGADATSTKHYLDLTTMRTIAPEAAA